MLSSFLLDEVFIHPNVCRKLAYGLHMLIFH